MFAKSLVGGMVFWLLMQISPQLAGIGLIVIPIVIVILTNKEEKKSDTSKYGYSPRHEKYENLPDNQKKVVDSLRDERYIEKDEPIVQGCRSQSAIPGSMMQRLNGDPQYYPSLKQFEAYGSKLSRDLDNRLMDAARNESREWTRKKHVFIKENNWQSARDNLVSVMKECESFGKSVTTSSVVNTTPSIIEPRKPFKANNDSLFD